MPPDVVVVAETPPSQPPAAVVLPQSGGVDGETIVQVAQIEAERDVAIAEQHTEQTQIMADAVTAEEQEDIVWLRETLDGLQARCATTEGELSSLRAAMLTMQEQAQAMAEQIAVLTAAAVIQADNPTPPPSTQEPASPSPPDPSGDGQETPTGEQDPPEPPTPPARGKRQRVWLR